MTNAHEEIRRLNDKISGIWEIFRTLDLQGEHPDSPMMEALRDIAWKNVFQLEVTGYEVDKVTSIEIGLRFSRH